LLLKTPDPTMPYPGAATYGASAFVLILPYLEQTAVSRLIDTTRGALSPVNMPPGNAAYSTPLPIFLCPSAPGDSAVDYSAELANSFNNFGVVISPAPGLIFGRSDYAPDAGMSADIPGININAGASIIAQPPTPPVRITDITDGSSNTVMLVEDAGKPLSATDGFRYNARVAVRDENGGNCFSTGATMSTATYTGIVHGKSVVLEDAPTPLPEGTRVLVTPLPEPRTPAALLAAIEAAPHITADDVAELEAILEAGKRPPSPPPTF
jgi:hypothetical protein